MKNLLLIFCSIVLITISVFSQEAENEAVKAAADAKAAAQAATEVVEEEKGPESIDDAQAAAQE